MKKRYVISIITVFIFLLSFFAYNKLFNKQISEDNNTIGIYLEDNYESNTYKLSDSSNIPTEDYIFNAEKTNSECPNAEFSYDSDKEKVQVNSNKSVECNMYFKVKEAPLEQLINYQFIYDGSLGEAGINGANTMPEYTGGWNTGTSYCYGSCTTMSATFNKNNITINTRLSGGNCSYYIHTKNMKDITGYNYRYVINTSTLTGSVVNRGGPRIVFSPSTSSCATSGSGITYADGANSSSPTVSKQALNPSKSVYIQIGNTFDDPGYINTTIYEFWITKPDNYTELASKINVTVSSIDDLLNNYSTQLLNNKKAIQYMIKQCTGDFMASAINNSTFMIAYASSPYKSLIDANEHWHKFITMTQSLISN